MFYPDLAIMSAFIVGFYTIGYVGLARRVRSPANHANLVVDDMITHVNGHPVHNLTHPQLMHRLLSNGNELILRLMPLASTSIREGAARRSIGKMARKKPKRPQRRVVPLEKKTRKPSALLRRLSGKRATNDIVPGSSSQKQAFMPRSASSQDGCILTHLPGTVKTTTNTTPEESGAQPVQGVVKRSVKDIEDYCFTFFLALKNMFDTLTTAINHSVKKSPFSSPWCPKLTDKGAKMEADSWKFVKNSARTDRYNHDAESCGEEEVGGPSAASSMMFHSFSTASPRHSIVSIDPAHLPHLLSTHANAIERSHSVSSSSKYECRPERSYSTGQAPPELFQIGDDGASSTAVNLRRRFSAQRHNVSTTSSSGTGSGTCFATAASSTDSSIDASSLPVFQPPSRGGSLAERGSRSPLPKFSISCEGTAPPDVEEEEADTEDVKNSTITSSAGSAGADETVRFRRTSSGRNSQLQLVIPVISQAVQAAENERSGAQRETCYVMYPTGPTTTTSASSQLSPGGASVSSASSNDIGSPHPPSSLVSDHLTSSDATSSTPAASKTITIRKGPFGFGFTLKSVRVYLGEHSEYYTIEHIVTAIVEAKIRRMLRSV
uniref:PDZ domain-containing protein n=2 Tax=Caenorhabditis japonica TaxID=281687 RepID=A0A8R1E4B4_CAEJA